MSSDAGTPSLNKKRKRKRSGKKNDPNPAATAGVGVVGEDRDEDREHKKKMNKKIVFGDDIEEKKTNAAKHERIEPQL